MEKMSPSKIIKNLVYNPTYLLKGIINWVNNFYNIRWLNDYKNDIVFKNDTSAIYLNHSEDSLKEMHEKAYLENVVFYDSKDNFLSTIRHEALYSAYILTRITQPEKSKFSIKYLFELPEQIEMFNDDLSNGVAINGKEYTYGVCLFNKWCGFDTPILNEPITKKQIQEVSRQIYLNCKENSKDFYDCLYELEKKLMFFISITNHIPTLSLIEMVSLVDDENHELIRKLPNGNAYVSYHIHNALIDRCIESSPKDMNLYKLYKSGSRFSKTQLARSCISIGLLADENNIVHQDPITSSLIEGLTEDDFFRSAPGTRKGL